MVEPERAGNARHNPPPAARRLALIGAYLAAAVLGYSLGRVGGLGGASIDTPGTPLARVGLALQEPNLALGQRAWALIRHDAESVRTALKPEQRGVFDLIVALRGLNNAGVPDRARAEEICRALSWQRCDRAALEGIDTKGRR